LEVFQVGLAFHVPICVVWEEENLVAADFKILDIQILLLNKRNILAALRSLILLIQIANKPLGILGLVLNPNAIKVNNPTPPIKINEIYLQYLILKNITSHLISLSSLVHTFRMLLHSLLKGYNV